MCAGVQSRIETAVNAAQACQRTGSSTSKAPTPETMISAVISGWETWRVRSEGGREGVRE